MDHICCAEGFSDPRLKSPLCGFFAQIVIKVEGGT